MVTLAPAPVILSIAQSTVTKTEDRAVSDKDGGQSTINHRDGGQSTVSDKDGGQSTVSDKDRGQSTVLSLIHI